MYLRQRTHYDIETPLLARTKNSEPEPQHQLVHLEDSLATIGTLSDALNSLIPVSSGSLQGNPNNTHVCKNCLKPNQLSRLSWVID